MTSAGRSRLYAILIAAVVFLAIAPTLRWMEFSGGSEDLNVGTVLEMRRGGPWIIPTLKGAPRTTKPPLTAWLTALAVRPCTVAALSDLEHRTENYIKLGWESRWPALLASCLLLVATYELAIVLFPGDAVLGLSAIAIGGSCILFLRFSRSATTDVYLAFFVTVANLLFAKSCFQPARRKLWAFLGGIALGLALMSKGPPALAQSTAPLAMYWAWRWLESRRNPANRPRLDYLAIAIAVAATLLVSLPWPIYANLKHPGQFTFWYNETIHGGYAETFKPDPWWAYTSIFPMMAPWLLLFSWGIILIVCDMIDRREKYAQAGMLLMLGIGAIVVMSCFTQKNERYLMPMVGPLAIVTAYGLLRSPPRFLKFHQFLVSAQWCIILVAAVGGALSFALSGKLHDLQGRQWMTLSQASLCAAMLLALVIVAWIVSRRNSMALQLCGMFVMLGLQILFIRGYSRSLGGASEMKPLADAIFAAFPQVKNIGDFERPGQHHKVPIDLFIYTDRIIRPVKDPAKLPASLVVVSCVPDPASAGPIPAHRKIASVPRGHEYWEAFIRSD